MTNDMKMLKERLFSAIRDKDYMAKGTCLLLAVILWAFIINGKTEILRYKIPIVVKNLPSQLAVSGMSDKYASIEIEGRKDELKSVNVKNIRAAVNLENAAIGGPRGYEIAVEKHQVPEDVSISLVRGEVEITVEKKEERWVRVRPAVTGSVRRGKVILDKQVIPERVKVAGPKSLISGIESVDTEAVSVEGAAGEVQRQVGLKKGPVKDITFSESVFTVKVLVADLKDLVAVTVPVAIINGARDYQYEIRDNEVEVYVRAKNGVAPTAEDIDAYVDAAKLNLKAVIVEDPKEPIYRDLPVAVSAKNISPADIVSIMPKRALIRIVKKQHN
jgi:hypothetical protein